jgi:hypothetical protein
MDREAGELYILQNEVFKMTITVNEKLYQRASEAASAQGKSLDEFVSDALLHALSISAVRRSYRNGLAVMLVDENTPSVNLNLIRHELEENGF